MRTLLLISIFSQFLVPQSDLLQKKFNEKLKTIVERSDAIIGVAIEDLKSGERFVVNEKELFPTASSIKIYVLAEVYRQSAAGKFAMTDIRSLPSSARVGGSGILSILGENSVSLSLRDYCVLMMHVSDNSATNFLIDLVGMKNVNDFALKNGCPSTKLQRVMMDIQAAKEERENISTPNDFLHILKQLQNKTLVSKEASEEMLSIMKMDKAGNLKNGLPASVDIANKAGSVEGVMCDAGIVYLEGNPYIICVMTKMLVNDNDGGPIITEISKDTYEYLERKANSNQYGRRIPK